MELSVVHILIQTFTNTIHIDNSVVYTLLTTLTKLIPGTVITQCVTTHVTVQVGFTAVTVRKTVGTDLVGIEELVVVTFDETYRSVWTSCTLIIAAIRCGVEVGEVNLRHGVYTYPVDEPLEKVGHVSSAIGVCTNEVVPGAVVYDRVVVQYSVLLESSVGV